MTSTAAHQVSTAFSSASNVGNYIRWCLRDTNGSLQTAFQVWADNGMDIYSNLYLAGRLDRTGACAQYSSMPRSEIIWLRQRFEAH